jgi:hypothetical protein
MKHPSKLFLKFWLINLFLISCIHTKPPVDVSNMVNKHADEDQLVVFDLIKLTKLSHVTLSEIGAIEIKYIPLKTTSQNVVSQINNIIFCNSYFLIYGYTSVSMFRNDGSFVTEVGKRGRGPDEFSVVSDVDINTENESIYIADGHKFLVFDKNGKFIRTFKSPLSDNGMNFKFTEDRILCYFINDEGNIDNSYILIDTTGKIIEKFPNRYPWKRKAPGVSYEWENKFYKFNNQLFKKEIYSDTIFSFENEVFKPYMVIDVGKQRLTPDIRSSIQTGPDFSVKTYHNYITPWNLFEFSDFIYYEMTMTLNGTYGLYSFIGSKKDNFKVMIAPEQGLTNDLDGGPNFWPRTIETDNTIVSWIEAIKYREYIASDAFKNATPRYPDKKKELEKLANSLKETDNPVLMIVRLKK